MYACGEGVAHEIVAHEHREMVAPKGIDGRLASAERRLVYHVVMYQRSVVQHLEGRGGIEHALVDLAEHLGREHHHYGANLLPLSLEIRRNDLIHKRVVCSQRVVDDVVHRRELRMQTALYDVEMPHK